MDNIGKRLKTRRLEHGYNQKDVASVAGVTNAAVSKWETNGGKSMSALVALRLAKHLGVNPHWLVLGEGNPTDEVSAPDISPKVLQLARRIDRLPQRIRDAVCDLLTALSPEGHNGSH